MDTNSKLFGKVLLVILPAIVSGFFSYKIAVVEADSRMADNKNVANSGYETLVAAVEKLQDRVNALAIENASIKGELKGLRFKTSLGNQGAKPPKPEPVSDGDGVADMPEKFELPKNLGRAWEQRTIPLDAKVK